MSARDGAGRSGRAAVRVMLVRVGGALGLEGIVRVRQVLRHGTTERTIFTREVDEATGLRVPVPSSVVGGIRINSDGWRGPELETPKPDGCLRIAFLGGSTTFCADVSSNEATWPHLVAEGLRAAAERPVDYVNAGGPGYSSKHSIVNLRERVATFEPDLVVIYHGTNDLNLDSIEAAEARGLFSGRAEEPSWLARHSLAWYLVEKNLLVRERLEGAGEETLDVPAAELSRAFEGRLEELVELAGSLADEVVLCTFQPRARAEQPEAVQVENLRTSFYYMPYMDRAALMAGFHEYNRVVRAVAARTGAVLLDLDGAIPGDAEHYVDSVHFNDLGAARMGAAVTDGLLAEPRILALLR
ncbi:MAG: SGNH/GDSL hydrolase family protein [Planctomycetota bacterium]|nr:SGNH/GDSL hydrolase family protein [Planctomycetota bacterium]